MKPTPTKIKKTTEVIRKTVNTLTTPNPNFNAVDCGGDEPNNLEIKLSISEEEVSLENAYTSDFFYIPTKELAIEIAKTILEELGNAT